MWKAELLGELGERSAGGREQIDGASLKLFVEALIALVLVAFHLGLLLRHARNTTVHRIGTGSVAGGAVDIGRQVCGLAPLRLHVGKTKEAYQWNTGKLQLLP